MSAYRTPLDDQPHRHDPATMHAAARTVAGHAHDATDARLLLTMLGLHQPPPAAPRAAENRPAGDGRIHGTTAGYRRHLYRREQVCDPCQEAWRTYSRDMDRARRAGRR